MKLRLARWMCLALMIGMVIGAKAAEPAKTVKVAAVQCSSELGDVEGNRKKLTALVEEAAAHGAKIVVLPEAAITGYLSQDLKTNWHVPGRPIERAFVGQGPERVRGDGAGGVDGSLLRGGETAGGLRDRAAAGVRGVAGLAASVRGTSTRCAWRRRRGSWSRTIGS